MMFSLPSMPPKSACRGIAALLVVSLIAGCNIEMASAPVEVVEADLDADFARELKSAPTVLVKFGATWCGPCNRLDKELKGLSSTLDGQAKIITIDVDDQRALAAAFGVGAIPHMILFKNGKAIDQKVGYRSADEVASWMGLSRGGLATTTSFSGPAAIQSNPFVAAE